MSSRTLPEWLSYLETQHVKTIDLGLERVDRVRRQMGLEPKCPLVMIGGTNGKGSVSAMLSTMLMSAGYKVGSYTSPHLLHYNERVAVNMQPASDDALIESFAAVEAGRGQVPLSYFEYGTLAAVWHFLRAEVDVIVLEVGLGGRLDAVNAFEPDVSVVVSIDLDHQDYLGADRESIGFEKAGIFRPGKPAVCADAQPPARLVEHAAAIGAPLYQIGRDFGYSRMAQQWSFHLGTRQWHALPLPALRGGYQLSNASAALAALALLFDRLPVDLGAIKRGLLEVEWPGRFQVLPGRPQIVLDVGHNPHAVRALISNLAQLPFAENRYAVFSMLADKDLETVADLAASGFDGWFVGGLDMPRGQSGVQIAERLAARGVKNVRVFDSVAEAWKSALSQATENDRIVVFGSFHTVAEAIAARSSLT